MDTQQQTNTTAASAPEAPQIEENTITLREVYRLEKRMGVRIWDAVLFNRDGITNPTVTILNNKAGRELRELRKLSDVEGGAQ
jgi:hypothetical protein